MAATTTTTRTTTTTTMTTKTTTTATTTTTTTTTVQMVQPWSTSADGDEQPERTYGKTTCELVHTQLKQKTFIFTNEIT